MEMEMETTTPDDRSRLWADLGMNLELHDQLLASIDRVFTHTHLWQMSRPVSMSLFDEALHASHGSRVAEIVEYRRAGGKSVGTFCIYVPDEIALAAGVLPIPLCGGSGWPVDYADRMFPRDICPLVRSTFGMAFSGTCPYKTLKEYPLGETTCDAKKKAWDLLGIPSLELPQKKNPIDRDLWRSEVLRFREDMEKLTGKAISARSLADSIRLVNRKRKLLQQINELRKLEEPPISGLDALLVSQVALNMDIRAFNEACGKLVEELVSRVKKGISAYPAPGPRVMFAGSPAPMGFAKVHYIVESAGMRIVVDESCTGQRYYRDLVDEGASSIEDMLEAIADRYFRIDCACFSPNTERMENVQQTAGDYRIDGLVHCILQYCHGYDIEAKALDKVLGKVGIPTLKVVTDYGEQDEEQIRVRVEAFREMITGGAVASNG
jgi:benzoyl-CoA reductase/2-hydroxyglutaryl-CoA dehydratase subunit BcrC/BadD/HgdB